MALRVITGTADVRLVAVAETARFIEQSARLMTEAEIAGLKMALAIDPEAGVLIPGTGGMRKLRWGLAGRGKRGGARVIYYFADRDMPLYLMGAYAKNERADLTMWEKREFAAAVAAILAARRR